MELAQFKISHRVPTKLVKGAICWSANIVLHVLLQQITGHWYGMAVLMSKRLFHTVTTIDDYFK